MPKPISSTNPLPQDGWIVFPDDSDTEHPYQTPAEMMSLLADSSRVRDCALLKLTQYLIHRHPTHADSCGLGSVRDRLPPAPTYNEMLKAIATSPWFLGQGTGAKEVSP